MIPWIILLRGVNVGGHNKLPMAELREVLRGAGFGNVRSYIQSGNISLQSGKTDSTALEREITALIQSKFGFAPRVMAITHDQYARVVNTNPFPDAARAPKTLHVFFLADIPVDPDLETIAKIKTETELYHLTDEAAYLYLPDGVWKSKLAARIENLLGVPATARNWRSVTKIWDVSQKKPKA